MSPELLLTALGLAFILEGLPYFLFPGGVREMASRAANMPPAVLRLTGLAAMLLGLLVIWLARRAV